MKTLFAIVVVLGAAALFAQDKGRSVRDGVFTQAQADRGKASYDAECAVCHGSELGGGDVPPALVGEQFMGEWENVDTLFDRIRKTMPANAKVGQLSRQVNSDITAFILSYNGYPAGKTELETKDEVLSTIRIEPKGK